MIPSSSSSSSEARRLSQSATPADSAPSNASTAPSDSRDVQAHEGLSSGSPVSAIPAADASATQPLSPTSVLAASIQAEAGLSASSSVRDSVESLSTDPATSQSSRGRESNLRKSASGLANFARGIARSLSSSRPSSPGPDESDRSSTSRRFGSNASRRHGKGEASSELKVPPAREETSEGIQSGLDSVLNSPEVRAAFDRFAETEFTPENSAFLKQWDQLADLAEKGDPMAVFMTMRTIIDTFIRVGSRLEVNISAELRKGVIEEFETYFSPTGSTGVAKPVYCALQRVRNAVIALCGKDTFKRFKESQIYKDLALAHPEDASLTRRSSFNRNPNLTVNTQLARWPAFLVTSQECDAWIPPAQREADRHALMLPRRAGPEVKFAHETHENQTSTEYDAMRQDAVAELDSATNFEQLSQQPRRLPAFGRSCQKFINETDGAMRRVVLETQIANRMGDGRPSNVHAQAAIRTALLETENETDPAKVTAKMAAVEDSVAMLQGIGS